MELHFVLINSDLFFLNGTLKNLNDGLTDLILGRDCVDDPVIKLLVNLSGVSMDLLKDSKGPRIDQCQLVGKDLFFFLKDDSLWILPNLGNDRVLINKVIEF